MLNSIWTQNVQLPDFPSLQGDLKTEVLIIGGGMAGLLCASRLAQEGIDYALIEADRICHGVTRNTTAKITSQHGLIYGKLTRSFGLDAARMYYEANEMALQLLSEMARDVECGFERKDHFVYSCAPGDLDEEGSVLEKMGVSARFVEETGLPFSAGGAIRFEKQAQFDPLRFAAGIARGLCIFENTRACQFVGNTVLTEHGQITASKIIVATHFPMLNKHGGYFLKLYQQRSYVLTLKNAAQVHGMYLGAGENGLSLRNHGELLLLGGGGHRTGKKSDGWGTLEKFARKYYPHAQEVCRWATQDCMTLDGMPYIGRYGRQTPNLYVATGFNKWGMTSSMLSAMILGDLICGRENPYAHMFSPQRTVLRPQLACNILESTVNLLTPTKPRCPHLGCALKWNRQERSWDCPCHGSRFSQDGKLLDNPATDDM